eukprot:10273910-Alexandrium_andersonii.AAC.1
MPSSSAPSAGRRSTSPAAPAAGRCTGTTSPRSTPRRARRTSSSSRTSGGLLPGGGRLPTTSAWTPRSTRPSRPSSSGPRGRP